MKTGNFTGKILTYALLALGFALGLALPAAAQQNALASGAAAPSQDALVPPPAEVAAAEANPALHKRGWRYKVNPSDTLELTFNVTPEFNQTVTVQPDGYITLKEVGDLQAAGKTLPELRDAIKTAYGKILHEPDISVEPKDFEKPFFTVGGQVGKPGKFDLRSDITLTQAIAIAGGFLDSSKHSQVLLFRRVSDQWTSAKIIDVKKMLAEHDLSEDPQLMPGDMLFVPKNFLSKIKPFLPTTSAGMFASPAGI